MLTFRSRIGQKVLGRSCKHIGIPQEQYINQLLQKFDMSECHTIETPIECKLNIINSVKNTAMLSKLKDNFLDTTEFPDIHI